MKQYCMVKAQEISRNLEDAAETLLDKLCEGEPADVRRMAWTMFVTSVGFANGQGDCFVLPPLDEI